MNQISPELPDSAARKAQGPHPVLCDLRHSAIAMIPSGVTWSGPSIDDTDIFVDLPALLTQLLLEKNGFIIHSGALHGPASTERMDIRFPVLWRQVWRSLTIFMSVTIVVGISIALALRAIKLGWTEGFRHISLLGLVLGLIGIVAFSAIFALGISTLMRLMTVRVTDEHIEGRNYWCAKRRVPLRDIVALSRFSSSGIEAIVVSSKHHGKVYISVHTAHLEGLVALLSTYLPDAESGKSGA